MLLYIYASEIDKEKGITEKKIIVKSKTWTVDSAQTRRKKRQLEKKIIQVNELT